MIKGDSVSWQPEVCSRLQIANKNMNKIENFIQKPIGYRLSKTTSENILKDIETTKIKTFQTYNQDVFIVE